MKRFFKKVFIHNMWAKIFSILMATLIWSMIMNASDPYIYVTVKNITVSKQNEEAVTEENMIYDVVSGESLNVTFRGPRTLVQNLTSDDIKAYVDMRELSITNSCPIHIEFKNSEKFKNVSVTSKTSEVMTVSLEKMVSENKQVYCEKTGKCADGYYAEVSVNPSVLDVYGSENAVMNVEKLKATIDISGVDSTFSQQVKVVPLDEDGNEIETNTITIEDNMVDVTVTVYKTKNVNVKIDANLSSLKGFAYQDIKYAPSTITIAGSGNTLNSLTEITIPYKQLDINETVTDNISLDDYIPEGCYLVSDTNFISITIPVLRLDENRKINVKASEIALNGLQQGLSVNNFSSAFWVSIWGIEGSTESLTVKDLGLSLDLSGINEAGKYSLPLNTKLGKDYMMDDMEVEIEVTAAKTQSTASDTSKSSTTETTAD